MHFKAYGSVEYSTNLTKSLLLEIETNLVLKNNVFECQCLSKSTFGLQWN
jgi:hypothetical protein